MTKKDASRCAIGTHMMQNDATIDKEPDASDQNDDEDSDDASLF